MDRPTGKLIDRFEQPRWVGGRPFNPTTRPKLPSTATAEQQRWRQVWKMHQIPRIIIDRLHHPATDAQLRWKIEQLGSFSETAGQDTLCHNDCGLNAMH